MTKSDPTETFRQEASELLEILEQALLDLGQTPDDRDIVNSAFRALHTLKGSGAMFGFTDLADFVHEFETAFDRVRKGEAEISSGLIQVALAAKDHIAGLVAEPGRHAARGEPILAELQDIIGAAARDVPAAEPDASRPAPGPREWIIRFRLPGDALVLGTNPLLLLAELRELGNCTVTALTDDVPPLEAMDPEACYLGWEIRLVTEKPREAIEDVFIFIRDGMELEIAPNGEGEWMQGGPDAGTHEGPLDQPAAGDVPPGEAPAVDAPAANASAVDDVAPAAKSAQSEKPASSLRVPAERLDELMDRVGELVIAQARLSQIAGASNDTSLKTVAEEIERLAAGLRDTTMGIRMVPIGTLFGRFRRLVHDLSGELGKDVLLETSGEETELDKTVIERLADPLVHIIRNAVDHGMEKPDLRTAQGKPARGRVRLAAVYSGAEVAISISDDGAGLDAERIRAKAVEAELIAADARLLDQELFQLIFQPGFSTARETTSVSGRGVGMDVVKRTIDALRGNIDVSSKPGEGTTVTLRLPLTLAIIEGMLVRVGKGRYSIPLSAVEECVELPASAAADGRGCNFLSIRGSLVPFLRLRELFGTQAPEELHQKVVIVSAGEHRVGLVVDQILGNNQTVIKTLSKLHSDVETFFGATILGDGTVALILDVAHLVRFGQSLEDRLRDRETESAA